MQKYINKMEEEINKILNDLPSKSERASMTKEDWRGWFEDAFQNGVDFCKKEEVNIELREWDYTCADGCCYNYGSRLFLNGKELDHPNEEVTDNGYVGEDVQTALTAVLKELGYKVIFTHTSE